MKIASDPNALRMFEKSFEYCVTERIDRSKMLFSDIGDIETIGFGIEGVGDGWMLVAINQYSEFNIQSDDQQNDWLGVDWWTYIPCTECYPNKKEILNSGAGLPIDHPLVENFRLALDMNEL